jgi:hypothetical protein
MRTYWLVSMVFVVAACGKVESSGGDSDARSDIDARPPGQCTPGEAQSCDGDVLVVCASDGMNTERQTCASGCSTSPLGCRCEANTSTCSSAVETRCDASGVSTQRSCALGCTTDGTRCNDIVPSNLLAQFLDDSETGMEMVLNHGSAIDTTEGKVTIDGLASTPPSFLLEAPAAGGGVKVRVFAVKSFKVTGELFVTGFPALAIVSNGDVEINGIIRSRAGAGPDGNASGGGGTALCTGGASQSIAGQGGGAYAGAGGAGGATFSPSTTPGAGGRIVGNPEIVPLRGGGNNAGIQGGGGAIQLVSRSAIYVRAGGAIDAGGAGGSDFGGGGGAGGAILLEAPAVTLSGVGSALAANGGGGGCYTNVTRTAERGRLDTQRAVGCVSSVHGDGGLGGAGATPDGEPGGTATGCPVVGGAGGGGVGRIRVNTPDMVFTPANGAIVSPAPSVGRLTVR